MTTTTNHEPSVTDQPRPQVLELRLPVDVDEAPLGYDDYGGTLAIEVMLAGGGYANLILPVDGARAWAGELFAAVTTAHREATGGPPTPSPISSSPSCPTPRHTTRRRPSRWRAPTTSRRGCG